MAKSKLNDPIFIAAWPGMGHVALTACYYLIAKLEMEFRAEYVTNKLYGVDHVAVDDGIVQPFRYPKNQFFVWQNPKDGRDLLLFIGEAQLTQARYEFCRTLIDYVQSEGVKQVFTFAALATGIELEDPSRVIGVAADEDTRTKMMEREVGLLRSGSISGMNGILLGVAAERGMTGGCLLGEMPSTFVNVPYPKASLAVLEAFSELTDLNLDLGDLQIEADNMEHHLQQALEQLRKIENQQQAETYTPDHTLIPDPAENGKMTAEEKENVERLFAEAEQDRSKAYALKRELDRLDVFREYEDRFLDLFKQPDGDGSQED